MLHRIDSFHNLVIHLLLNRNLISRGKAMALELTYRNSNETIGIYNSCIETIELIQDAHIE